MKVIREGNRCPYCARKVIHLVESAYNDNEDIFADGQIDNFAVKCKVCENTFKVIIKYNPQFFFEIDADDYMKEL